MIKNLGVATIDDFDLRGKCLLVRVDLNSPLVNGRVALSERILEHIKTIKELQRKKAKVVILAHQGRPGDDDFVSLKQHAKLLNRFIRVRFIEDIVGKGAIKGIKLLKRGEALLLENVRFLKEEFSVSGNNRLIKTLAPLFDLFVLDAFSVAHRKQASVTGFARVLPSCLGRSAERELRFLSRIKDKGRVLYILGGAKIDENFSLIKHAVRNKTNRCIVAGLLGQLCLIASGIDLGAQNRFFEKKKIISFAPKLKGIIKRYGERIEMPLDVALKVEGKREEVEVSEFPKEYEIFDIGTKTIRRYVKYIKNAASILIKGPPGYYQERQFRKGTRNIFNAVPRKAFSVIGGGDTTTALKLCGIRKSRFTYVSLSGGALAEYLAGKKLPGLEALKKARKDNGKRGKRKCLI